MQEKAYFYSIREFRGNGEHKATHIGTVLAINETAAKEIIYDIHDIETHACLNVREVVDLEEITLEPAFH